MPSGAFDSNSAYGDVAVMYQGAGTSGAARKTGA